MAQQDEFQRIADQLQQIQTGLHDQVDAALEDTQSAIDDAETGLEFSARHEKKALPSLSDAISRINILSTAQRDYQLYSGMIFTEILLRRPINQTATAAGMHNVTQTFLDYSERLRTSRVTDLPQIYDEFSKTMGTLALAVRDTLAPLP